MLHVTELRKEGAAVTKKASLKQVDDMMFSMDIGTRSIVGMIARNEDGVHHVLDYEIFAHPDRAMLDGQIHDIGKVAWAVRQVKENLESRTGLSLDHVAIAAAGRSLRTRRVSVERDLDYMTTISKELTDNIEMEAIQQAQSQLDEGDVENAVQYYCVGYTVINYYLDDAMILAPREHRGNRLKVDMIATFLPHSVVDSLYTVMDQVGLEVVSLTLEPIAAINVAIPPKFRLLNLALVDVGAGTSDIAITKDGAIVSYAMVSEAGDEITEALAREFLLDFDSAERLKTGLFMTEDHSFTDIVGFSNTLKTEDILKRINPVIAQITENIAQKILEFNGRAPSALFCIGGGGQVPGFTKLLAQALDMPEERAVIKGVEALENLRFEGEPLRGPEYVTPVGIGFTALKDRRQDFLQVTVNEKSIRLFNSRQLSVSDALILIGFSARKLIARRGEAITITINGQTRAVSGEYGEPAKIHVNGREASLDTRLKNKDDIRIEPAVPGLPAQPLLREVLPLHRTVDFQGESLPLICEIRVNGTMADPDTVMRDGDVIETKEVRSVSDFLEYYELDSSRHEIHINGTPARRSGAIFQGDIVTLHREDSGEAAVQTLTATEDPSVLNSYDFIVNGSQLKVKTRKRELVFVDIFDHFNFDRSVAKGIIGLTLNGNRASYLDKLKSGDVIDIFWT